MTVFTESSQKGCFGAPVKLPINDFLSASGASAQLAGRLTAVKFMREWSRWLVELKKGWEKDDVNDISDDNIYAHEQSNWQQEYLARCFTNGLAGNF
jgi:hypothetical protein